MDGLTEGTPDIPEEGIVQDQSEAVEASPNAEVEDRFTDLDPTETPGELSPEWLQERYKQMQGDYTRKTQAAAEAAKGRQEELDFLEALRSDRDTQLAVLEQLSELLNESEDDETEAYDGEQVESNPLEQRLAQLEEERANERAHALASEISSHIDQLAKTAGVELDEEDARLIFERAVSGDIGKQHTEAAFKAFHAREQARYEKWQKSYLASKQAPTQIPGGQSATDTPDLTSASERIKRMAAIMQGG